MLVVHQLPLELPPGCRILQVDVPPIFLELLSQDQKVWKIHIEINENPTIQKLHVWWLVDCFDPPWLNSHLDEPVAPFAVLLVKLLAHCTNLFELDECQVVHNLREELARKEIHFVCFFK